MSGVASDKLTTKQARFVDAYCGNATEAALVAGYSPKTAAFIGAENLKKPKISAAIKERETQRNAPLIATREERQAFWTKIMNSQSEETRDRLKASELLGKSEADFTEKREVDMNAKVFAAEVEIIQIPDNGRD